MSERPQGKLMSPLRMNQVILVRCWDAIARMSDT